MPKKIVFNDDGEIILPNKTKKKRGDAPSGRNLANENDARGSHFDLKGDKSQLKGKSKHQNAIDDDQQKWFLVYPQFPTSNDVLDMKESEQVELFKLCKNAFDSEQSVFSKRNPADSRWLHTALYKGTAKDRANAGALLVTSNPLGNLEALTALVNSTRPSNKSSPEVISILTDLWKEVLLPPYRKLLSIPMRAADWKLARQNSVIKKDLRRIYAYWHFENELKDQYFEFLKNLQQGIQTGQESNKNASILSASQLLVYAPEKEQMLLTMLINKLGDPSAKVASKALHHLTDVSHRHPNMCGVIVAEAEKLLFRNNISERAQHFALCFLACIAPAGRPEVCTKLVHICFSLFKVLVRKGAVNNRTMQAILRCLQRAILDAQPANGSDEIMDKEMQDTIYRLVHLADIRISVQTLSLLLQLVTVKTQKTDRFYNALYGKMLDLELTSVGTKTAAHLLHIIHRAIHIDANLARAQAFIKRLLQIALHMPGNIAAGCLIVIQKLLHSRKELAGGAGGGGNEKSVNDNAVMQPQVLPDDLHLVKFDSDGDEKYEDQEEKEEVLLDRSLGSVVNEVNSESKSSTPLKSCSWYHTKIAHTATKTSQVTASKYDAYYRVPSYAGAEYAIRSELLLLREHFHPTVQIFADNILNQKRIDYYGDPLRDFGLPHFLERFAFKNPKKIVSSQAELRTITHKHYLPFGTRGKPIKSLTKDNCTEDEIFIFNYLEQKRQKIEISAKKDEESDMNLRSAEVNDDEFEEYIGGYFGKKFAALNEEKLDFLKEFGDEIKTNEKKQRHKKISKDNDYDDDKDEGGTDIDADWGDDNDDEMIRDADFSGSNVSDDEVNSSAFDNDSNGEGSISLDEGEIYSESNESADENEIATPKQKKSRQCNNQVDSRSFAKKLKHSDDMRSLFAAADDFAELLEDNSKVDGQGTTNAIFNKDKSSAKQLKWEEKRRSNAKNYRKKSSKGGRIGGKARAHNIVRGKRIDF